MVIKSYFWLFLCIFTVPIFNIRLFRYNKNNKKYLESDNKVINKILHKYENIDIQKNSEELIDFTIKNIGKKLYLY